MALVHAYIWKTGHTFPGAPQENHIEEWRKKLGGFAVALFGDNHRGFLDRSKRPIICNSGGFMRRKSDEREYQPCFFSIYEGGHVDRLPLLGDNEIYNEIAQPYEAAVNDGAQSLQEFIAELDNLTDTRLDFVEAVNRYIRKNGLEPEAAAILKEALGDGN